MRRTIGSLAISGLVGACFTSAVVLAQAGGGAPAQAPAAEAKRAEGELRIIEGKLAPSRPEPIVVPDKKGRGAADPKGAAAAAAGAVVQANVRVRAAVIKGAQPAQANRAPLIQQFTNQASPLLRAELLFARNVCQLNREELRKINREAQEMLDEVVAKLVDAQFQPRARLVVQPGGKMPQTLDSQQLLHDGVVTVMKKNLSAVQWSRYDAELKKRDENRKSATIRYFVDAIDREVYLTPEQCDRLEAALEEHWDSGWTMYLENHLFGNRYYPMTIDPIVTPLLSDAQRKVWGGVPKVGVYWGFSGMLAGFANDMDGLEVELGEPARRGADAQAGMGAMMKMQGPVMQGMVVETREVIRDVPAKATSKKKAAAAAAAEKQLKRGAVGGLEKSGDPKQ